MSKYSRFIKGTEIDVYDILLAYQVTHPAIQHAIKKLLMPGQRGDKNFTTDVVEAMQALGRAVEMEAEMEGD